MNNFVTAPKCDYKVASRGPYKRERMTWHIFRHCWAFKADLRLFKTFLQNKVSSVIFMANYVMDFFQFWEISFGLNRKMLEWSKVERLVWFVRLPRVLHRQPFSGRKMEKFLTLTKIQGMPPKYPFSVKVHFSQQSLWRSRYQLFTSGNSGHQQNITKFFVNKTNVRVSLCFFAKLSQVWKIHSSLSWFLVISLHLGLNRGMHFTYIFKILHCE